ncbi:unnamed protein product [Paramecium sonneborni]|uniref:Uncharacterized protein n=1 Tax=Paramecium sonneborni TaxID=65129 RepID=A0A8S1MKN2_9CILI|nr:unnamed protein product [Paramecium sonneborni]
MFEDEKTVRNYQMMKREQNDQAEKYLFSEDLCLNYLEICVKDKIKKAAKEEEVRAEQEIFKVIVKTSDETEKHFKIGKIFANLCWYCKILVKFNCQCEEINFQQDQIKKIKINSLYCKLKLENIEIWPQLQTLNLCKFGKVQDIRLIIQKLKKMEYRCSQNKLMNYNIGYLRQVTMKSCRMIMKILYVWYIIQSNNTHNKILIHSELNQKRFQFFVSLFLAPKSFNAFKIRRKLDHKTFIRTQQIERINLIVLQQKLKYALQARDVQMIPAANDGNIKAHGKMRSNFVLLDAIKMECIRKIHFKIHQTKDYLKSNTLYFNGSPRCYLNKKNTPFYLISGGLMQIRRIRLQMDNQDKK